MDRTANRTVDAPPLLLLEARRVRRSASSCVISCALSFAVCFRDASRPVPSHAECLAAAVPPPQAHQAAPATATAGPRHREKDCPVPSHAAAVAAAVVPPSTVGTAYPAPLRVVRHKLIEQPQRETRQAAVQHTLQHTLLGGRLPDGRAPPYPSGRRPPSGTNVLTYKSDARYCSPTSSVV